MLCPARGPGYTSPLDAHGPVLVHHVTVTQSMGTRISFLASGFWLLQQEAGPEQQPLALVHCAVLLCVGPSTALCLERWWADRSSGTEIQTLALGQAVLAGGSTESPLQDSGIVLITHSVSWTICILEAVMINLMFLSVGQKWAA